MFDENKNLECHTSNTMIQILFSLFLILTIPAIGAASSQELKDLAAQGNEAFTRRDFQKAEQRYEEALQLTPNDTALMYNKANALYKQEKYSEALELYEKAIRKGAAAKISSSIFFNAANTALQLAELQTKEKQDLSNLKKALAHIEKAFELYRNAIEQARANSIAEGRSVKESGLYARQNWALARVIWNATWEKIRELEKKNMKLEDGISNLLQAQRSLLPNLEHIYLNSLSDDILTFNLKRQAEYQLDYREDILALKELAVKEEKDLQAEIDNAKSASPTPQAGKNQPPAAQGTGQSEPSPELERLQAELKTASEIKKAMEQAAAFDEWITDGLKRSMPIQAWQNNKNLVELLENLYAFYNQQDVALQAYQNAMTEVADAERLLAQAKTIDQENNDDATKTARQKRFTLAEAKIASGTVGLDKINFFLADQSKTNDSQVTDGQNKEKKQSGDDTSHKDILAAILKKLPSLLSDQIISKNSEIKKQLLKAIEKIKQEDHTSLQDQLLQAGKAALWYQHMGLSIEHLLASIIQDTENSLDLLTKTFRKDTKDSEQMNFQEVKEQLQADAYHEKMTILFFQLENVQQLLQKEEGENTLNKLTNRLTKQLQSLQSAWKKQANLLKNTKSPSRELLETVQALRVSLMRNLLLFSPETAISLYYNRAGALQESLLAVLPARDENKALLKELQQAAASEAASLNSLLVQYFKELEESIETMENQERQTAHKASLEKRGKSIEFLQRLIEAGKDGVWLLDNKKMLLAELLLKDTPASLKKSQMAFKEQPKDAKKALTLAMEFQKKHEEQSRLANEAATLEATAEKVIKHIAANQQDIKAIADSAIVAIEQGLAMAEVPTHGQAAQPQTSAGQPSPEDKKEAITKIVEAKKIMDKNTLFIQASEFHNTFQKHDEIVALLQKALDLLNNKQKQEKGDKDPSKQNKEGEKNQQQNQQNEGSDGNGQQRQKKPLQLSPEEARQLLQELNDQDNKQQEKTAPGKGVRSFNTPRPW